MGGDNVPEKTRLDTDDKVVALTMDACGSRTGMGVDMELVNSLRREKVPATLFINARWIGPNRELFDKRSRSVLSGARRGLPPGRRRSAGESLIQIAAKKSAP